MPVGQSPSRNTHMTPPCGTSVFVPRNVSSRDCIRWASTPHPDCTAMYCTPSTMYELGTPVTPEFVLNSQSTAPVVALNARKFLSFAVARHPPPSSSRYNEDDRGRDAGYPTPPAQI